MRTSHERHARSSKTLTDSDTPVCDANPSDGEWVRLRESHWSRPPFSDEVAALHGLHGVLLHYDDAAVSINQLEGSGSTAVRGVCDSTHVPVLAVHRIFGDECLLEDLHLRLRGHYVSDVLVTTCRMGVRWGMAVDIPLEGPGRCSRKTRGCTGRSACLGYASGRSDWDDGHRY